MNKIDLCLFIGQSNMAGRGITSERWPQPAPALLPNAGYEFRALSDPTRLYPVTEPFGVNENQANGINDVFEEGVLAKTGSLVTSFCNACYVETGVPIVGISASKGGSHIAQWQPESKEKYLDDAISRFQSAEVFLLSHGYQIRHRFMVWCQGESDGDLGTNKIEYERLFNICLEEFKKIGIQKCFLIQIGYCNHTDMENDQQKKLDRQYRAIQDALEEITLFFPDTTIVSRSFVDMRSRGLMKDAFHYYQQGYNECGTEAGKAAAEILQDL